jgi:hypothetical protein
MLGVSSAIIIRKDNSGEVTEIPCSGKSYAGEGVTVDHLLFLFFYGIRKKRKKKRHL